MQRRQVELDNKIITEEEAQQQEADEQTVREKYNIKLAKTEDLEEDNDLMQKSVPKNDSESDSDDDDIFTNRDQDGNTELLSPS